MNKPILVSGSHRSGSTWVGKVLATSPEVGYIHEPFNLNHRPGICRIKLDYWFTHIADENQDLYYQALKDTLEFNYRIDSELARSKSLKDYLRIIKYCAIFANYRFRNARPLLKDPIALFSAEWLASTFDADVLILIRHPAAFVSSIKQRQWSFPFAHFLNQPLLIQNYLSPFNSEIKEYAEREFDLTDQAILLWRIFHHVIWEYQRKHKNWIFIKHEELSLEPSKYFQKVFGELGLYFSESVQRKVKAYTNSSDSTSIISGQEMLKIGSKRDLMRDSRLNASSWKQKLTPSDINKIKEKVQDVSRFFYSEAEWV